MKTIQGFICYCVAHETYNFFSYDASKCGNDWIMVCEKTIEFDDSPLVKHQINSVIAKIEDLKNQGEHLEIQLSKLQGHDE